MTADASPFCALHGHISRKFSEQSSKAWWLFLAELGVQAGTDASVIAQIAECRRISTSDYLRLCVASDFDPLPKLIPALSWNQTLAPSDFDFPIFAMALQIRRGLKGQSRHQAAQELGLTDLGYGRIEQGWKQPIGVVLRCCRYMEMHPFSYLTCVAAPHNVSRVTYCSAASK